MIVTPMSLATFFETISQRAENEGYKWVISLIGRYADAEKIYDEIERTWASLNDLTNDRIAFIFSSFIRTKNNDFYRTPHKEPYVGRMCPFARVLGSMRFADNDGDFDMYYKECKKVDWKDVHTQSITEFIRTYNIEEQLLPGIFIYELRTKKSIFVHIDSEEKIYNFIKLFVIKSGKLDDFFEKTDEELAMCEHRNVFELEDYLLDIANAKSANEKKAIIDVVNGSSDYLQNKNLITNKEIRRNLKRLGQWRRQQRICGEIYIEKRKIYEKAKENYEKSILNIEMFLNELEKGLVETQKEIQIKDGKNGNASKKELEMNKKEGKIIIFFADEWGFSKGGINVFNRLLCEAMGIIKQAETLCISTNVAEIEIEEAGKKGVKLINVSDTDFSDAVSIVKIIKKHIESKNIFWVGHDIKTGNIAIKCRNELIGSKCAIIHHMAYAEYYPIINRDADATEHKEQEQREVLHKADIIFANGPVLQKSAQDIVGNKVPVIKILPGIAEVEPRSQINNTFKVVTFGRVEQREGLKRNNSIIKQTYLAVAAWSKFAEEYIRNRETIMKVYGKNEDDNSVDREMEQLVKEHSSSLYAISAVRYEKNRKKLLEILSEFSLCLVLSLREGFGLTAIEAISAGVPLIVSKKSGFYEALKELRLESYVYGVDIQGKTDYPFYSSADLNNVKNAMYDIFLNENEAKLRTIELREKMVEAGFTWTQCAETILQNITEYDLPDSGDAE